MAGDTKSRLIETAGELFYRHGFQAVGLDQILGVVGITKTAFYKHFESKDRLIVAVLEQRDQRDIADALAFMREHGGADPRAQILAFFDQLAQWFDDPEFRGCLFMNAATEFPSRTDPIHRAAIAHAEHIGAVMLRLAADAGAHDAALLSQQIVLLMSGAITARHTAGARDAAQSARAAVDGLLRVQTGGVRPG